MAALVLCLQRGSHPNCSDKVLVGRQVSNYSLLILWEGRDASLKPAALLSHLDVVPADEDPQASNRIATVSMRILSS